MERRATIEAFGYRQELRRSLGLRDLVVFGIVFMAPVSSMSSFGVMAAISHGHNFLSYVIGFAAMLFTANSYGTMVEAFPIAGSAYSYTQRGVHPTLGFIAGWVMLMDYFLMPMLLYVVGSIFAHELAPQIPYWAWLLIYVVAVTFINIKGVEVAAKVNLIMTGFMVAAILAFVTAAVNYAITDNGVPLFSWKAIYNPKTFSPDAAVSGSVLAVLCYLGFDGITTLSEEVQGSTHKIRIAIFIALFVQSALYFTVAYLGTVVAPDFTAFRNADAAFLEIACKVGGSALQTFISLVIIVTGASTALAGQSAAGRLLFGMGRDGLIPAAFFAYLHPKYKTPTYNILLMAIVGIIGALTISLANLCNMISFGGLFGFICVNLSVISHYYLRGKSRNVVGHVLCPLMGMGICGYILAGMSPLAKVVGFSWMGAGIAYLAVRSIASRNFKDMLETSSLATIPDIAAEFEE